MPNCGAIGCRSRITFHKIPRDVERRKIWIAAVGGVTSENVKLCSLHFEEHMFERTSENILRLKKDAVPTICNPHPSCTVSEKMCTEVGKIVNVVEATSSGSKEDLFSQEKTWIEVGEIVKVEEATSSCSKADSVSEELSDSSRNLTIIELKRKIQYLEHQNEKKNKKIKSLEEFKCLAMKKIRHLEGIIKSFKENRNMDVSQDVIKSVTESNEEFLKRHICKDKNLSCRN